MVNGPRTQYKRENYYTHAEPVVVLVLLVHLAREVVVGGFGQLVLLVQNVEDTRGLHLDEF